MDKAWIKIISITGAVGVVGLLISIFMSKMFNSEIINLLGSEKLFFILILLVFVLFTTLIVAIMKPKSEPQTFNQPNPAKSNKDIEVIYDNGSTHNGDNNF